MQGHDFIFFLQDKQNRFWGLDASGSVTISANPYPLVFSPDGWQEIGIKNIRNKKYWAIDRSVTIPFKYVEDGAKIIKYVFYTKGVEEPLFLSICEQRLAYTPGVSYGYWYKVIFKSEVDLSTFGHDGPLVTVTCLEEGLSKHLKANENTVYPLDLNVPNAIKVKADGIVLREKQNFITQAGLAGPDHVIGTFPTNKEGKSTGVAYFQVFEDNNGGAPFDFTTSLSYFMATTKDISSMVLAITLQGTITAIVGGTISWSLQTNTGRTIAIQSVPATNGAFSFTTSVTFDALAGEKFFLYCNVPGVDAISYEETNLSISFKSRYQTTYIPARRPYDVFNELIMLMSDGEYTADDCPFLGELENFDKVFTSGDGIRELPAAKLKISFTQFFSFFNSYDEVGIREKNKKVLLARKSSLTDYSSVIDLGEIARPKIGFDKSFPYNELAIGFPDVKNEEGMLNGKNEFNTTFVFSLGTTKNPRKMEKISQVKGSCYDNESVRILNAQNDTTDNKSDNDPYVLHIEDTITAGSGSIPDHYQLDRSLNAFLVGVDEKESVFNVDLSPKRSMVRSGDFLRSSLYKCEGRKLKFISADRNDAMEYINGADFLIEKADQPVSGLAAPFFTPVTIDIETPVPDNYLSSLDENPLQVIRFSFQGEVFEMVPMETGVNPQTNKAQQFSGLSAPGNNLTKLIEYYG
jgi:hypothetical protein